MTRYGTGNAVTPFILLPVGDLTPPWTPPSRAGPAMLGHPCLSTASVARRHSTYSMDRRPLAGKQTQPALAASTHDAYQYFPMRHYQGPSSTESISQYGAQSRFQHPADSHGGVTPNWPKLPMQPQSCLITTSPPQALSVAASLIRPKGPPYLQPLCDGKTWVFVNSME